MEKKINNKTYDKILTTAYFIVLNVFKKIFQQDSRWPQRL